ncbi:MAG: ATP-binding cassette domain-containing protein [Longibaculum sp.]
MLEIRNINISYAKTIFQDAKVTFDDGSLHAITGPSGCGKTTLIKAILDNSKNCEIYYNQEKIIDNKDQFLLEHVFYVDQNGSYFSNMNIYQHFQFYAEINHRNVNNYEIDQYLEKVGLKKINVKRSPSQLSIGERKRFLIALALFSQKDILIFDEPTASLDKKSISLLKEILLSLKDKTIILTTHEEDLLNICDVIYEIKDCHIVIKKEQSTHKMLIPKQNKFFFKPFHYLKYKSPFQWLQQIFLIVIGIFLCIQLGIVFNNEYALFSGLMGNSYLANDNMIYMRKRQANAPNWMYVTGEEWNSVSLTQEELTKIKQIDGIKNIYNIGEFSVENRNDTSKVQNIKISSHGEERSIEENDTKVMKPQVKPYFPENGMDKNNKKIFVAHQFALEQNIQIGDIINISMYVPVYQYVYNEEREAYRYISYKVINKNFEIDGISDVEKSYKNFQTPYVIYIPYQQYQDIIKENNGDTTGDKPQFENVEGMNYTQDDYVIFTDKEKIKEVYQTLTEMNEEYDVFSQSVFYSEGAKEEIELQGTRVNVIIGISAISSIVYGAIYYFQLRSKRRERQQLRYNGISNQDIKKSILLETVIHAFSWIGLSLFTVLLLGTQYVLLNIGIFIAVALVLSLIEQGLTYLVMHKEEKELL